MENKKNQTPQQSQQQQSTSQTQSKPQKSNTVLIIIIILIVILAGLGAGGWFTWQYFANKAKKTVSDLQTKTALKQNVPQKLKDLEDLFKYPNASLKKLEHDSSPATQTDIEMETPDTLGDVYYHYMSLSSFQKWGLGSRGISTLAGGAFMRIEEKDFVADFNFSSEAGKTAISFTIKIGTFEPSTDYDYDLSTKSSSSSSSGSAEKAGTTPTNGYILPNSNTEIISELDLVNLTPWQLKVARNEIYARHGRPFVHKDLQCYFAKQNWYKESPNYSNSMLSSVENKNITTILNYEEKINSPLLRKDSGC